MTKKLLATFLVLVLAGFFLFGTIFQIDPNGDRFLLGFGFVLGSIFLGGTAFFTLLIFFGKELLAQKKMTDLFFWRSVRKGAFISGALTICLWLSYANMLSFVELFMVIAFFSILEFLCFFSQK